MKRFQLVLAIIWLMESVCNSVCVAALVLDRIMLFVRLVCYCRNISKRRM